MPDMLQRPPLLQIRLFQTALVRQVLVWCACFFTSVSWAHPHLWIDAKVALAFNPAGQLAEIRQTWLFDEMFSSYAALGTDKQEKGVPDSSELDKIRNNWMLALADPMSHYFTSASMDGKPIKLGEATASSIEWDRSIKRIALQFTLPVVPPIQVVNVPLVVNIADPTYFVSYDLTRPQAVSMQSAPSDCKANFVQRNPLDAETIKKLAAIPANAGALPPELLKLTQEIQNRIELVCTKG